MLITYKLSFTTIKKTANYLTSGASGVSRVISSKSSKTSINPKNTVEIVIFTPHRPPLHHALTRSHYGVVVITLRNFIFIYNFAIKIRNKYGCHFSLRILKQKKNTSAGPSADPSAGPSALPSADPIAGPKLYIPSFPLQV